MDGDIDPVLQGPRADSLAFTEPALMKRELMKRNATRLIALGAATLVTANFAHGAEGSSKSNSAYSDISIYDLPEGSASDLGQAMREYDKDVRNGSKTPVPASKAGAFGKADAEADKIRIPQDHIYETNNASTNWRINPDRAVTDYSLLKIQPPKLEIVSGCELLATQYNGIKLSGLHTGYAQFFKCKHGNISTRDMLLEGVRTTRIAEQFNISFDGISGTVYGVKDSMGNSYTHLNWISNNTDHVVEKSGTGEAVRAWLADYAEEVIAQGR
ncbi:hypothetical protein ALP03_00048 [Pseudomonas amygdali pv. tabaci]|uniref:Uncharacterized protein n=1 Tax=Pseudomonas amygdali pv. tabaci TaxID=322 RepID=A0A3M6HY61_PSEAJ|nr:hypothetical protein ALP03_00048 [Pseudomonas amygdali pv. tabaci]